MSSSSSDVESNQEKQTFKFPRYVGFILGNEFCERYSFYGMRTILVLYLTYFIGFDEDTSTVIYHGFTVLAYLFPLLGAAIADGYWGKYKTILWLSVVYCIGMALFAFGALPFLSSETATIRTANAAFAIGGLLIIAFGTGGIKPCVSSFGGDQFDPRDEANTNLFFDLFYWAINAGSLISTFLSPLIREQQCGVLGTEDSCYFIAFAIPAVLMVVAVGMFIFGTRYYVRNPPSGSNIFVDVIGVIFFGAIGKAPEGKHWLYGASPRYPDWLIRDTTYAVRVMVIFLPLPIFWAAFDQQGSRWTLQAVRMDGYIFNNDFHLLPDQAQLLNPILILTFIPLFNLMYKGIDALGKKCTGKPVVTRLRKMGIGMVMAAVAYIVSAAVQNMIDVNLTVSPDTSSTMSLRVINMFGRTVQGTFYTDTSQYAPLPEQLVPFPEEPAGNPLNQIAIGKGEGSEIYPCQDGSCVKANGDNPHSSTAEIMVETNMGANVFMFDYVYDDFGDTHQVENAAAPWEIDEGRLVWNLAIFGNKASCLNATLQPEECTIEPYLSYPGWASKDPNGNSHIIMMSGLQQDVQAKFICMSGPCQDSDDFDLGVCMFNSTTGAVIRNTELIDGKEKPFLCVDGEVHDEKAIITLTQGIYQMVVSDTAGNELISKDGVEIGNGGAYTFTIFNDLDSGEMAVVQIEDINSNDVNLLWIIPQFFTITVAEVMISITGLEFAYSQAPKTLKSVLTSFWLLTVSVGNIVVIIVAEGKLMDSQVGEYLLFAGLILGALVIFLLLAVFYYEYVPEGEFDSFEYPTELTGVTLKELDSDDEEDPDNLKKGGAHDNKGLESDSDAM